MFVQLSTTYLCEAGVSDLLTIKTKSRNRLDARNDIRLAQSKTEPNIQGLLERGQALCTNLVNKTDCDIKFFDFFVVCFFFCCCFYFLVLFFTTKERSNQPYGLIAITCYIIPTLFTVVPLFSFKSLIKLTYKICSNL